MSIKDFFEQSSEYKDLQALIMFLVFEKKVLQMSDDAKELDIYFKEKHSVRMNKELASYKKKMSIKYDPYVFELKNGRNMLYVYAHSENQAMFVAAKDFFYADEIRTCDTQELITYCGNDMTFQTMIKDKKAPQILGGF